MGDYNIISPLAPTHDERGEAFMRGLGDTPVNPFLSGVEGAEKGLQFGADITAEILKTREANDPNALAADQLKADLVNKQLDIGLQKSTQDLAIQKEYGRRQAEANIKETEAKAYKAMHPDASPYDLLRADNLRSEIAKRNAESQALKDKNAPASASDLGLDDSAASNSGSSSDNYDGSFPTLPPKASQAQDVPAIDPTDPSSSTQVLQSHAQLQQKARTAKTYDLTSKAVAMPISMQRNSDGTASLSVQANANSIADDGHSIDPAVGLATISQLADLHKNEKTKDGSLAIAGATQTVLDNVGPENLDKYIEAAPESQREYLTKQRNSAAAIIAGNGNPQYLSVDQKVIHAANLPSANVSDPDKTFKETLSLITDGNTGTTDPDLKNALDGNQYHSALTAASKNGKQGVTIRQIPSPPAPKSEGPDISGQAAPPPTMTEFRGDDGTVILTPTPVIDSNKPDPSEVTRQGQLRFAEQTAAKLKDVVSVNRKTDEHIQGAQAAVQQGAMSQDNTAAPAQAPTAAAKPASTPVQNEPPGTHAVMSPELGEVLSPTITNMHEAIMHDGKLALKQRGVTNDKVATALKNLDENAKAQVDDYNKRTKSIRDEITDATKAIPTVQDSVDQMKELIKTAQDQNLTGLFGPQSSKAREALILKAKAKGIWDYITHPSALFDGDLTPKEQQQVSLIKKMEQVQSGLLLKEIKGKATALRTNAEQLRAMQAQFNVDTPFNNLLDMAKQAEKETDVKTNALDLETRLLDRGMHIDPSKQQFIVEKYATSGMADPNNPNYRSPIDFLYGQKKPIQPTATATPTATPAPAAVTPDVAGSGGSGGPVAPEGDVVSADQKKNPELTSKYDTALNPQEAQQYEQWRQTLPKRLQSTSDYDLQGYFKANGATPFSGDMHMPDTFKKPNHPTFSNQSRYSNAENPGGTWNNDQFIPPLSRSGFDQYSQYYQHTGAPAEALLNGIKNLDPRVQADVQKQIVTQQRALQNPDIRSEIETAKADLETDPNISKRFVAVLADNVFPKKFTDFIASNERASYDTVANGVNSAIWGPETANQWQHARDVKRTAQDELTQDDELNHPFGNAAAAMTAFGIWKGALGGAGGMALEGLKDSANPTVQSALTGLQTILKNPIAAWTAKTAGTTATEAGAFAIPNLGDGHTEENLTKGALTSLFFHKFVGPLIQPIADPVVKGVGRAIKNTIRQTTPYLQQTPDQALGGALTRSGVHPSEIDASLDAAGTASALGTASPNMADVVREQTSTPEAQRTLNASENGQPSLSQTRTAAYTQAQADAADVAGLSDKTVDQTTQPYREAVAAKTDAEIASMTADQKAVYDAEQAQKEATRVQGLQGQSAELRTSAAQLKSEAADTRTQAAQQIQMNESLKKGGVRQFVQNLIGKPISNAKTALKALVEHTNISAGNELTSSGIAGGSESNIPITEGIKNLEASQQELRNTYSPEATPGDSSTRMSLYKVMEETYPQFDTAASHQLGEDLRADNSSFADRAISDTNRSMPGGESSPDMQSSFKFLDELHRRLGNLADTAYSAGNKVDGPIYQGMRDKVAAFLDDQIAQTTDSSAPGLGQSEKPYTELNQKYGAVRETERKLGYYKKLLTQVDNRLQKSNSSGFHDWLFTDKNTARIKTELGPELTDQLRENLRQIDIAHKGIRSAMGTEPKAKLLERKAAGIEAKAGKIDLKAATPGESKPFTGSASVSDLSESLKTANKFVGPDKVIGDQLLNAKDPTMIRQVQDAVGPENQAVLQDAIHHSASEQLRNGKALTEDQWRNMREVMPAEQVDALQNFEKKAASLERGKNALASKSVGEDQSAIKNSGLSHNPVTLARYKGFQFLKQLFKGDEFQQLTKAEQSSLTKALASADNASVNDLLKKTAESMRKVKKPLPIREVMSALTLGEQNARDTSEAQKRADAKAKASPENIARQKKVDALLAKKSY